MKKYLYLNVCLLTVSFFMTVNAAFSQQIIVSIKVNGVQGASKSYTVCKNSTFQLSTKNASLTPPAGGAVYDWKNLDTMITGTLNQQSINRTERGRWVSTIKYYNNTTASWVSAQDTVFINYYPYTPMQFLKGDGSPITSSNMTICGVGDSVVSVTPGFSNYKWYKDSKSTTVLSTTSSLLITQALLKAVDGNKPFLVEAEDANGCPVNNYININRDESVTVDLGNDIKKCLTSPVTIASPSSGNPGITRSFLWSTGETAANNIQVSSGGTYWLRVTNKNASGLTCRFSDTIKIKENKDITVSVTKDTTICYGSTVQLTATVSPASGVYTYDWNSNPELSNNSIANPTAAPTTQGLHPYTVSVKDNTDCSASKSVNITVLAPNVNPYFTLSAGNDTSFCGGVTPKLNPSVTSSVYPSTYTWSWSPATGLSNASDKNPTVSLPGSGVQMYTLTATDARGCKKTASVNVNQYAPIVVAPNFTDSTTCFNALVNIITSPSGGSGSGYVYTYTPTVITSSGNSAQVQASPGSTMYQISVEDNTGCSASENVTVTGYAPSMYIAHSDDTIAFKSSPQVPLVLDAHTAATNVVNWYYVGSASVIATGPTYGAVQDEQVYAQVTDPANNCFNRDTVNITFFEGNPYVVFVPTAFSPKAAQEVNRSVKVFGTLIQESDFTFKIYNQWGQVVYHTASFSEANVNGWTGDSAGQSNAVYTYMLKGKFYDGTEFSKTGTTTMLQ